MFLCSPDTYQMAAEHQELCLHSGNFYVRLVGETAVEGQNLHPTVPIGSSEHTEHTHTQTRKGIALITQHRQRC